MSNQRITPPAGSRIGMSDMNQEYAGVWNRRTGMAEAGTWVGIPSGTRHGFDSYWGKSNIQYRGDMTLLGTGTQVVSSHPNHIASLNWAITRETTIVVPAGGYMILTKNGARLEAGTPIILSKLAQAQLNYYMINIGGLGEMARWIGEIQGGTGATTTETLTFNVYY